MTNSGSAGILPAVLTLRCLVHVGAQHAAPHVREIDPVTRLVVFRVRKRSSIENPTSATTTAASPAQTQSSHPSQTFPAIACTPPSPPARSEYGRSQSAPSASLPSRHPPHI